MTNNTLYLEPLTKTVGEVHTSECMSSKGNLDIESDKVKGSLVLLSKGHELQNEIELIPLKGKHLFEKRQESVLEVGCPS